MADNPKLTKSELAALDFLIAEAEESKDTSVFTQASWTALAREAVRFVAREAARQAVREAVRAAVGGALPQDKIRLTDEEVRTSLREFADEEPSLERLVAIREQLNNAAE